MSKNYIGEKEVVKFIETSERTPAGATIIEVFYVDGTKEIIPYPRYENIISPVPLDASKTQEKIVSRVASTVYGVLHEYGMRLDEIDPVMNQIATMVNSAIEKANNYKWGVEYASDRNLLMVNNVLLKINTNGTTPTGGGPNSKNKK